MSPSLPHPPESPFRRVPRQILQWFQDEADLVTLWWGSVVGQFLVPPGHPLARADLVPWMMSTLAVVAIFQARRLGPGHHPSLTARNTTVGLVIRRGALFLFPLSLWGFYDAGAAVPGLLAGHWMGVALPFATAAGLLAGSAFLRWATREEGRTPWNPPGPPDALLWTVGSLVAISLSLLAGLASLVTQAGAALLLGVGFLGLGLLQGSPRNLRQRLRARLRSGKPYRPPFGRLILALVGPSVGLYLLYSLLDSLSLGPIDFNLAFVVALHVISWAGMLWPAHTPVAVPCLLHEVVPTGGGEEDGDATATGFERPPEGALRLNPLDLRRTRNVHAWMVPVEGDRIRDLDDPIQALWVRPPAPLPTHILGDVAFRPRGGVQTEVITVLLPDQSEMDVVSRDNMQTRRIAVLRAYPRSGRSGWTRPTYRGEQVVPKECLQVVDGTTTSLELRDGDIIVLSVEGVARAFELEMGEPIRAWTEVSRFRIPQIEDYTKG